MKSEHWGGVPNDVS